MTESDLDFYATEFGRTGFQGGLNWYRCGTVPGVAVEMELFDGRRLDVPSMFIGGERDWGIHQTAGALNAMETACSDYRGTVLGLARHLWRAFSILRCPPFELKRADEVERRMAADGIVEAVDVTADCARGFDPALEEGAPDEFGLEGLEERLDHGVVEAVSLARHRDRDAVLSQLSLVLDGAVLAATVRVVNEPGGWTPHGDGPA